MGRKPNDSANLDAVIRTAASFCNVSLGDLLSSTRERGIAWPRQLVMLLAREHTTASTPQIAKALGGRDHTTIIYGIREARVRVQDNPHYRRLYLDISASLEERGIAFRNAA
jgi:chromosomal replication initiator protein